jgi:hypothetical protein
LNLIFYFVSPDYRDLLQRLKYSREDIVEQKAVLLDKNDDGEPKEITEI